MNCWGCAAISVQSLKVNVEECECLKVTPVGQKQEPLRPVTAKARIFIIFICLNTWFFFTLSMSGGAKWCYYNLQMTTYKVPRKQYYFSGNSLHKISFVLFNWCTTSLIPPEGAIFTQVISPHLTPPPGRVLKPSHRRYIKVMERCESHWNSMM